MAHLGATRAVLATFSGGCDFTSRLRRSCSNSRWPPARPITALREGAQFRIDLRGFGVGLSRQLRIMRARRISRSSYLSAPGVEAAYMERPVRRRATSVTSNHFRRRCTGRTPFPKPACDNPPNCNIQCPMQGSAPYQGAMIERRVMAANLGEPRRAHHARRDELA